MNSQTVASIYFAIELRGQNIMQNFVLRFYISFFFFSTARVIETLDVCVFQIVALDNLMLYCVLLFLPELIEWKM